MVDDFSIREVRFVLLPAQNLQEVLTYECQFCKDLVIVTDIKDHATIYHQATQAVVDNWAALRQMEQERQ